MPKKTKTTEAAPAAFPIVGIGASAGGLAAFEAFFSGMPADQAPGMAFVLVQHLSPDHKSILSELIRRYTRMQVFEVEDGMVVQPNCAYIIPPNYDMAFMHGALHLMEPVAPRGQRLSIDYFFQSLAADQREQAIGVVLSGTGSDGTLGVRAIKEAGGMVMVQSTASSEFDGMPRSAIATGLADYQLPPAEMAVQLMAYTAHALGKVPRSTELASPQAEATLKKIFVLLRAQTGHDFSQYKPSTIYRRIERRMAVQQVATIEAYVKYLQQTPAEAVALFRDLLIGVTNFFRDPEAFAAMEAQVIPSLFEGKAEGAAVRVWCAGCSTGEEAYSLAILLIERMEALKQDDRAVATARTGVYPASIAADISPERLARFFTLEPGGQTYRVHKGLRDLLVFSEQDLIKDPPFSKLDLISCRNLLIYLDSDLQKKLIPLFHYALRSGGTLFLGSSEGVGEFDALFAVLDRKTKLYLRKDHEVGVPRFALGSLVPGTLLPVHEMQPQGRTPAVKPTHHLSLRELTEQALLKHMAPASALVNAHGDIAYLHGRTGMYLEPVAGEAGIQNILKMSRDGLRLGLGAALHNAAVTQQTTTAPGLRVKTNGHHTLVNVRVHPMASMTQDAEHAALYLVMLEDAPAPPGTAQAPPHAAGMPGLDATDPSEAQARIEALTEALRAKDEYLQSTYEELESSNEELKSSVEEMQSVNEELQSANEELETSKEELQSLNEELATVNAELQTKVADLSHANNDMNNLLAGTGIGTVFVDFQLRILRFTPAASRIINLIASDVGRPVAHIVSNLVDYTNLVPETESVLSTLVPIEREVQTIAGQWYALRIQPYRTLENVIEGAVISFVEISETVRIRSRLAVTQALMERTGELARVGGWELDVPGMALYWSPETCRIHDVEPPLSPSLEQALHFYAAQDRPTVQAGIQACIDHGTPWEFELPLTTAKGRAIWIRAQGVAEMRLGKVVKLRGAIQDITERRQIQEALREANAAILAKSEARP